MFSTVQSILEKLAVGICILAMILLAGRTPAYAQDNNEAIETQRLAQTGMKFLSLSVDPRAAAMGDAVTALEGGSSASMLYNPAGMARMDGLAHVSLAQVQWIANTQYSSGVAAVRPFDGRYGTVGFSIKAVDYPEFLGTVRADNELGFEDTGSFSPSALSFGLGYARVLTDRFSIGGNIKYARQSLGESVMSRGNGGDMTTRMNSIDAAVFDLGMLYRTGFRSLNFAVSLRNFARELTYAEESFELPLTFNIGASMDVTDLYSADDTMHSLLLSIDARRPRDYAEQFKIGGEYKFMDLVALRAGYTYPNDEQGINVGGGVDLTISNIQLAADYGYSQMGIFGDVHRLGLQFGL